MYNLKAFGLNLSCDFSIPELLIPDDENTCEPDVIIKLGNVSKHVLGDIVFKNPRICIETNEHGFLIDYPDIARYLVRNGNEITIDMSEGCSMEQMETNLLGSAMTALLMQRNVTILHANAINFGGNCISFSGNSGSGKSVISAAFMQRGYSVLTDDMCVIDRNTNVAPGLPKIKLRDSSCEKLCLAPSTLAKVHKNHEKRHLPLGRRFYTQKATLKLLYVLVKHSEENIEFHEEYCITHKMRVLKNQSIKPRYLIGLRKEASQLKRLANIAPKIRIVRLFIPKSGFDINELMSLIQEDIVKRGLSSGDLRPLLRNKALEDA